MKACSQDFYIKMDSMLNVVYKSIKLKMSTTQRDKITLEQREWLKKRDLYFKKAWSLARSEGDGLSSEDIEMIAIDKKAQFVKDRVLSLINYIQTNRNSTLKRSYEADEAGLIPVSIVY
ncbi:lysozyme inhibitor LprI family protein [Flavobacterium sp.]|uniref:lysozyme inhibitor LprI family protein n=1 Tax=Flavobacterium sp. TaxID=239 RepID=UPI00260F1B8D|nr:lysozyme inhibitor LprI family protein [Flavobacterium sp.]